MIAELHKLSTPAIGGGETTTGFLIQAEAFMGSTRALVTRVVTNNAFRFAALCSFANSPDDPAGAPERARTDAAVREFADAASDGAPGPWRAVIRSAAREGREQLPDALDQAIASTELKAGGTSWWWTVFNVVQWVALLTALGGFAWLGVLAALGYFQLPVPEVPLVQGWPVPTVMIAGGALLEIVLAVLAKFIAGTAARARGRAARKRLKASVAAVAEDLVVEPVELEVSRLGSFNTELKAARGR